MSDNDVRIDALLAVRMQLIEIIADAEQEATDPQYSSIGQFTEGTIAGLRHALDLIDGDLALLTADRAAIAALFSKAGSPVPGTEDKE